MTSGVAVRAAPRHCRRRQVEWRHGRRGQDRHREARRDTDETRLQRQRTGREQAVVDGIDRPAQHGPGARRRRRRVDHRPAREECTRCTGGQRWPAVLEDAVEEGGKIGRREALQVRQVSGAAALRTGRAEQRRAGGADAQPGGRAARAGLDNEDGVATTATCAAAPARPTRDGRGSEARARRSGGTRAYRSPAPPRQCR